MFSRMRSDKPPAQRSQGPDLAIPEPSRALRARLSPSRCRHSLQTIQSLSEPHRSSPSVLGATSAFEHSLIVEVHPFGVLYRSKAPDLVIPEPSRALRALLGAPRCRHSFKPSQRLAEALRASPSVFGTTSAFEHSLIAEVHPSAARHCSKASDLAIPEPSRALRASLSVPRCRHSFKPSQRLTEALRSSLKAPAIDRGSNTDMTPDNLFTIIRWTLGQNGGII